MVRAGFRKGAKIERIERRLDNPDSVLKQLGAIMVAEAQEAHRDQRFGDVSWPARGEVNTFGILADFKKGAGAPPSRRFQTRPALFDTGDLSRSYNFRIDGESVVVGNSKPYATAHHRGEEVESERITDTVAQRLWGWLKKQGPERKRQLGWLLNAKFRGTRLKTQLPERPIVGITDQTMEDVQELVNVEIYEIR